MNAPELILYNGAITTLDEKHPQVSAVAITGGRITAVGGAELLDTADDTTQRIDLKGRRVIPGLNDSHIHVIRGGLNFNMELRWDGVPSLAEINQAAPDTPVFVLHLYDRAIVNGAALRVLGYTRETPNPPGGEIQRDRARSEERRVGKECRSRW